MWGQSYLLRMVVEASLSLGLTNMEWAVEVNPERNSGVESLGGCQSTVTFRQLLQSSWSHM